MNDTNDILSLLAKLNRTIDAQQQQIDAQQQQIQSMQAKTTETSA